MHYNFDSFLPYPNTVQGRKKYLEAQRQLLEHAKKEQKNHASNIVMSKQEKDNFLAKAPNHKEELERYQSHSHRIVRTCANTSLSTIKK